MSEGGWLAGRVVAIVGTGSDGDRALAVAAAEAGADVALGTESNAREQDYGMNSIANEIWAIGREHFVKVLLGPEGVAELVGEARGRLGGCDVVVTRLDAEADGGVPVVEPRESVEATLTAVRAAVGAAQAGQP